MEGHFSGHTHGPHRGVVARGRPGGKTGKGHTQCKGALADLTLARPGRNLHCGPHMASFPCPLSCHKALCHCGERSRHWVWLKNTLRRWDALPAVDASRRE